MLWRRLAVIAFFLLAIFPLDGATAKEEEKLCEILSPRNFEKFHSFPLSLALKFTADANLETFIAELNGQDITTSFTRTGSEARALLDLTSNLRINIHGEHTRNINILKVGVKSRQTDKYFHYLTNFFINVDQLVMVGREGSRITSSDSYFYADIPPGALAERTPIALTKIKGSGRMGTIYQLSPESVEFRHPFTVGMSYERLLPPGVTENLLLLLGGLSATTKLDNIEIDRERKIIYGTTSSLAGFFLSHYAKIGKKISDIPFTSSFRLPVGDIAVPDYTCGVDYVEPAPTDQGENIPLLQVGGGTAAPAVTFNRGDENNNWQVVSGFNESRPGQNLAPALALHNNGEDWYFQGKTQNSGQRLPVHAAADGLVISSGRGYGNSIVLAHQTATGLLFTVYSQLLEKSLCGEGSLIKKGNVIGIIGPSGGRAPALHFEIVKQALVIIDANGEILAPSHWFGLWDHEAVEQCYYHPTNFFLNYHDKYKWRFNVAGDFEGWRAACSGSEAGGTEAVVGEGSLCVTAKSGAIQLLNHPVRIAAGNFNTMFLRMKCNGMGTQGKLSFLTEQSSIYCALNSVDFELINDGQFHDYTIALAANANWRGIITGLRLDYPELNSAEAAVVALDNIRLGRQILAPTPDTGQNTCYDGYDRISCPAPGAPYFGQDGNYVINPLKFEEQTIKGEVVIHDVTTGLSWQKQAADKQLTWQEAADAVKSMALGGFTDWRVPTRKELQTIYNYGCQPPAPGQEADLSCFAHPAQPSICYWTATTDSEVDPLAQKVCFDKNSTAAVDKTEANYVLAVRGEPIRQGDFMPNHDGTITDLATDLTWQEEEFKSMTWEDALSYCNKLRLGGYADWRLPSIRELATLVREDKVDPAVNMDYFAGTRSEGYWSSTTHLNYPDFAWYIDFKNGLEHGGQKGRRYFVRAVRGGSDEAVIFSGDVVEQQDVPGADQGAEDEEEDEDEDEGGEDEDAEDEEDAEEGDEEGSDQGDGDESLDTGDGGGEDEDEDEDEEDDDDEVQLEPKPMFGM